MASIKRDDVKQQWNNDEFPLVCETCLGDNPYVRMTKEKFAKQCAICENPFTVFAWQAGTKGRLKRVEICKTCAQTKNVCQVCIYDLQYGLPVAVRDKVIQESGQTFAQHQTDVPQSMANRAWFTAQQKRALEQGQSTSNSVNDLAHAQLSSMANMEPRYERNLPKLCSFFAKGECNRGSTCPFRHELPPNRNATAAPVNTKDRFFGKEQGESTVKRGKKPLYGIQRDPNDPTLPKRAASPHHNNNNRSSSSQQQQHQKQPPTANYETARATLYVAFHSSSNNNNNSSITQDTIRDHFYAYGELVNIVMLNNACLVQYTQPEMATLALAKTHRSQLQNNTVLSVQWGRASSDSSRQDGKDETQSNSNNNNNKKRSLPPPPSSSNSKAKAATLPTKLLKMAVVKKPAVSS